MLFFLLFIKRIIPCHWLLSPFIWSLFIPIANYSVLINNQKKIKKFNNLKVQKSSIFNISTDVRQLVTATRHQSPNCTNFVIYYQLYEFFHLAWCIVCMVGYKKWKTRWWQMIIEVSYQPSVIFRKKISNENIILIQKSYS